MSGLNEIIQWVSNEVQTGATFDEISAIFERDGRLPLDQILGSDRPNFQRFLDRRNALEEQIVEIVPDVTLERITTAMVALFGE